VVENKKQSDLFAESCNKHIEDINNRGLTCVFYQIVFTDFYSSLKDPIMKKKLIYPSALLLNIV
jgi:hypothetical protein